MSEESPSWPWPRTLMIRDIRVDPACILAPMEGVTDLTFRRLVRSIGGCGLFVTEFISADGLYKQIERAMRMARFDEGERPISIQIYGRDPHALAEGARMVEALGADIIDLNMGCPSKKVCAHSGGSALMKEPELARQIVSAIRAATDLPFTVKMRAGWDSESRNAADIAWMCQEEGAEMVAVHWRTRKDLYGGDRDLTPIAAVKDRVSIPVVANGDIVDVATAVEAFRDTGCDAVMVGRGAVRNPWVFAEIRAAMNGMPAPIVDDVERERVLLGYFAAIRESFRTDLGALGRFKKIARYFTAGVEGGDVLRQQIFHSQTAEEAIDVVQRFFDGRRAA